MCNKTDINTKDNNNIEDNNNKVENATDTVCSITDKEEIEILAHIYNQKLIDNCFIF